MAGRCFQTAFNGQAMHCHRAEASERLPHVSCPQPGPCGGITGGLQRQAHVLLPVTCQWDLIWKKVFAEVIKEFEMRSSCIIQVDPNPMTVSL